MEMTNYRPTEGVRHIRARLDHPLIDSDGHLTEFIPLVPDRLTELAGESVAQRFDALVHSGQTLQGVNDECAGATASSGPPGGASPAAISSTGLPPCSRAGITRASMSSTLSTITPRFGGGAPGIRESPDQGGRNQR